MRKSACLGKATEWDRREIFSDRAESFSGAMVTLTSGLVEARSERCVGSGVVEGEGLGIGLVKILDKTADDVRTNFFPKDSLPPRGDEVLGNSVSSSKVSGILWRGSGMRLGLLGGPGLGEFLKSPELLLLGSVEASSSGL